MEITPSPSQKITPFLWFNQNAEEAAQFYTSVFPNARITSEQRYPQGGPAPAGTMMSCTFELEGMSFMALNGGPHYTFSPAISFFVNCEDQTEVDALWDKFSDGGTPRQCGWIQDKFGLCWQIIPKALGQLLHTPDPARASRVMQAMMKMVKIDVAALQRAYDGES